MRQVSRLFFIALVVGWLLNGCSQKIEPQPPTYSQLLTGTTKKSWRMVSLEVIDEGKSSGVIPVAQSGIDRCVYDDLITFYADANHTLEASEGATKCSASSPDIYVTDTWILINASASLQFYIPVFDDVVSTVVKNLTANVLTVELYNSSINLSYRFTFNMVSTQ